MRRIFTQFTSALIPVRQNLSLTRLTCTQLTMKSVKRHRPTKKKSWSLGGGPNRIGQGIEFDYCCVHAALAMREDGYETIMVNCNPETVSTDYDTSDRLYFEPITFEDVLEIVNVEKPKGVIVQYGGQTPLKLARASRSGWRTNYRYFTRCDRPRRRPWAFPTSGWPFRFTSTWKCYSNFIRRSGKQKQKTLASHWLFVRLTYWVVVRWKLFTMKLIFAVTWTKR